jgi:hypothetical protein
VTLIAQAYIHVKPPEGSDLTLERSLEILDEVATRAALEVYRVADLDLMVEEGSRKAWAGVLAIGAVFTHYGSVRSSIDYMIKDAKWFGEIVTSSFVDEAQIPAECVVRKERRLGVPGRLRRALEELNTLSEQPNPSRGAIRKVSGEIEGILQDIDEPSDQTAIEEEIPRPYKPRLPGLPPPSRAALPPSVPEIASPKRRRLRRRKRVGIPSPEHSLFDALDGSSIHALIDVREDGELVELDDGSLWRIAPGDITQSVLWLPTQSVRVSRIDSGAFRLRNLGTGSSVSAVRES